MPVKKFTSADSGKIIYQDEGKGDPVVLLHGFAEDHTIWERQVDYLKEKFRLIMPDIPGSGGSPFNEKLSTMDDYARVIRSILDHESIVSCQLIGHSMGGYITLAFAEKNPEMLESFGLFHSTAYADNEEKKNARKKGIEFIRQYGSAKFIEQTIPNLFSDKFKAESADVIKELLRRFANFNPASLVRYYEGMMERPDRTHVLKKFKKPVLFIMGEYDTAIPLQQSLEQCHLPDFSYIHIAKNSGHMAMLEESNWSNHVLEKFLGNV